MASLNKHLGKRPSETPTEQSNSSTPKKQKTITIMTADKFHWLTTDFHCIKCNAESKHSLFCDSCSEIKKRKNNQIQCNSCKRYFNTLIDSHCPECTTFYKLRYKKVNIYSKVILILFVVLFIVCIFKEVIL